VEKKMKMMPITVLTAVKSLILKLKKKENQMKVTTKVKALNFLKSMQKQIKMA